MKELEFTIDKKRIGKLLSASYDFPNNKLYVSVAIGNMVDIETVAGTSKHWVQDSGVNIELKTRSLESDLLIKEVVSVLKGEK